jgi:hypothetical protein
MVCSTPANMWLASRGTCDSRTRGDEQDLGFVLAVLSAFEGKPRIFPLVREIVAAVDPTSPLLQQAHSVLGETRLVSGEFGFAELYATRKALLEGWLGDASEKVRMFAAEQIGSVERAIAAETRSAEAEFAQSKLESGEERDSSAESSSPGLA